MGNIDKYAPIPWCGYVTDWNKELVPKGTSFIPMKHPLAGGSR